MIRFSQCSSLNKAFWSEVLKNSSDFDNFFFSFCFFILFKIRNLLEGENKFLYGLKNIHYYHYYISLLSFIIITTILYVCVAYIRYMYIIYFC